jgi:two-component system, LuxR family, response regulator FixJ
MSRLFSGRRGELSGSLVLWLILINTMFGSVRYLVACEGGGGNRMSEVKRQTIAVVDDDDAVRDSLRLFLDTLGHPVVTFASDREFLAHDGSGLACLILDHHMPEMTGLQLAEQLRASGNQLPILLVTGLPSPSIVARAAELGIERVLEKPPDEDDFLEFIASHTRHVLGS